MESNGKIAVVGATGRAGHHTVNALTERGHEVVEIARSKGVDIITGEGLEEALAGVTTIVDAATGPSPEEAAATEFFTTAARNLQAAGERAGARQIVVVSIIGIDGSQGGYGAAKIAHERAYATGPIPARILRASQFHEFVGQLVDWGREGDVAYVPPMRTQLVASRTVGEALAGLATEEAPSNGATAQILEIAGPREERLVDVARVLVAKRGEHLRIEERAQPGDPDAGLGADGSLLPGPDATLAGPTFEEWLESAA
ncbi:MAG TPA: NAD(P)H-binding protein [Thermoleophilaceae bacterium]